MIRSSKKNAAVGTTGDKNAQANAYNELLLDPQNTANLDWSARLAANAAIRREFRLGLFPPSIPKKSPASPMPPAPPTPPSAPGALPPTA